MDAKKYCAHGLEELMTIQTKAIYRFNAIPTKTNDIFLQNWHKNSKICMETQKTPSSWKNLEKEEQSWRYHAPWFQTTLQSYSAQNSMVLAQIQAHRSMEQNRQPRNEPTLIQEINLWQRRQEYTMQMYTAYIASSINGVGKTGQLYAKKSNWTTHIICKSKLKLD